MRQNGCPAGSAYTCSPPRGRAPTRDHPFVRGGQIVDHDIEVELLRPDGVAPLGWLMIGGELERIPELVSFSAITTQSGLR